jgi:hypothetical protein
VERKIILFLLLIVVYQVKAQKNECFHLLTDRDLYISGETILLKFFAPETEKSGTVKIDLINHEGNIITGINKQIIDQQEDGYLYLPDSLESGCYLLRIASGTSTTSTIKEIYISNRFKGLPETSSDLRLSEANLLVEDPGQSVRVDIEPRYKTTEKGNAVIYFPSDLLGKIAGKVSVSIASFTKDYTTSEFVLKTAPKKGAVIEDDGIILDGIVTDKNTDLPFKKAFVYLSIPDSIPELQYFITGDDGKFYFHIRNYYGKIPVIIQCFASDKTQLLKLRLTNPESFKEFMPHLEVKTFAPGLKKYVERNTEAVSFQKIFNQKEVTIREAPTVLKSRKYPFYGLPSQVVDLREFIELPDFAEISRELLQGIKFRTYNRIPTLQVFNNVRQYYYPDPPLLLIDGIPVRDLNIIKNMGSKDIDRIEICQNERYFGDLKFEGVVAIYTSKADYMRFAASDDLIRSDVEVMQPKSLFNPTPAMNPNDPDFRRVLLWNPSVNPQQTIPLEFQTSDIQGSFRLKICWKTKDGSIFSDEKTFEVY